VELGAKVNSVSCQHGSSNKGKGKEAIEVEEVIPDVLGSSIHLGLASDANNEGSSGSCCTPPIALLSLPSNSSNHHMFILYNLEKENCGVGWKAKPIVEDQAMSVYVVCGQCATHSKGFPNDHF